MGEQMGADVMIFRVGAEGLTDDPDIAAKSPEHLTRALLAMGELDRLRRVAASTRAVRADAVAFACTSSSFLGDPEVLARQIDVMRAAAGAPATTTSVAIRHALERRNLRRICLLTPYPSQVGTKFGHYLTRHGWTVLGEGHVGAANDERISALRPEDFLPAAGEAWRAGAEGWVISCTSVRHVGLVHLLEQKYGVPVIAANPATLEHAIELAHAAWSALASAASSMNRPA
jgi:maleate cis-trans isomerase